MFKTNTFILNLKFNAPYHQILSCILYTFFYLLLSKTFFVSCAEQEQTVNLFANEDHSARVHAIKDMIEEAETEQQFLRLNKMITREISTLKVDNMAETNVLDSTTVKNNNRSRTSIAFISLFFLFFFGIFYTTLMLTSNEDLLYETAITNFKLIQDDPALVLDLYINLCNTPL